MSLIYVWKLTTRHLGNFSRNLMKHFWRLKPFGMSVLYTNLNFLSTIFPNINLPNDENFYLKILVENTEDCTHPIYHMYITLVVKWLKPRLDGNLVSETF